MAKNKKETPNPEPTNPTSPGPVLVYEGPKEPPVETVTIWTYGSQFQAKDRVQGNKQDIDKLVTQILTEGYTSPVSEKKVVVYPPHTIEKIEVIKD